MKNMYYLIIIYIAIIGSFTQVKQLTNMVVSFVTDIYDYKMINFYVEVENKNIIDFVVIMVNNSWEFFVLLLYLSTYSLVDKQMGSNTFISDYSHTL